MLWDRAEIFQFCQPSCDRLYTLRSILVAGVPEMIQPIVDQTYGIKAECHDGNEHAIRPKAIVGSVDHLQVQTTCCN
jgi:hypothetical protein